MADERKRDGATVKHYCTIVVPGIPRPGGSKSAFPFIREIVRLPKPADCATTFAFKAYLRSAVRIGVTVSESGTHTAEWRKQVVLSAKALGLEAPVKGWAYHTAYEFRMPRPQGHFATKGGKPAGLKPWAVGLVPNGKPDELKLIRSVEDALTGIVWQDDAEVVIHSAKKIYGEPGVTIEIHRWLPGEGAAIESTNRLFGAMADGS